jgi:hypothetical protein
MAIKKYKSKRKSKKQKMVKNTDVNMSMSTKTKKNIMIGSGYNQIPSQYGKLNNTQKNVIIKIINQMIRNRKKLEKQKDTFKGKRAYKDIPEAYE